MRNSFVAVLGLLLAACASTHDDAPSRPPSEHTALLRDGGTLHGRIAGGKVSIRTQFGDVEFTADRVARIWVSTKGVGHDVVVTTEGDRIEGAFDWERFAMDDGNEPRSLRPADLTDVRIAALPEFDPAPVHVALLPNEDLLVTGSLVGRLELLAAPHVSLGASNWRAMSVFDDVRRMRLGASPEIGYHSDGLRITSIVDGSPAERAGWKAGDVITSLEGKPVRSNAEVVARRDAILSGTGVYMLVELKRDGQPVRFLIER